MKRVRGGVRNNWQRIIIEQGLVYGSPGAEVDGRARPYWDESVHYEFEMDEILGLEAQVEVLHSMCLDACEHIVLTERFAEFGLPEWSWGPIKESWHRGDPYIYGRFDLRYDGRGPAKLLEYNADTPTSLLEAAIVQWHWLTDVYPDDDQWNSLHEKLVDRWTEMRTTLASSDLHFTWSGADSSGEDNVTTAYMQETAAEAGWNTVALPIEEIGWDTELHRFVDLADATVHSIFKLYPWEWVLEDDFGKQVAGSLPKTTWIEPLWKTLLSNKALLAVLWEMYPGHPNLLPAYVDDPHELTDYIRKPKLGREGANMTIVNAGHETATGGVYGAEGYVYQLFDPLPAFDGMHPVVGAWMVGDSAAGMGIRETPGLITDDSSTFVPHRIPTE
ncbi:glutathionylspermidine synthase family protein [Nocardia stercoris]|uniref:Glutathionylspermidine synthase family protein n=1 Tax=Nocardia stercoris TaxID=2483361 RepID=A0A3M2LFE5_9NOCA|nr:glutathionylspermidine synthase family protein [Nocardia stercoris]RMI35540.1 glutathionylspermidine synthase family protein [Nocardia stercoris]